MYINYEGLTMKSSMIGFLLLLLPTISWGATMSSYPTKTTPVAADTVLISDSQAANATKKATLGSINPTDATITTTDVTTNNATTSKHGWLVKATAPASGLRNVVAIDNGETAYTNKALFDATSPSTQAFGDAAAVGTAMTCARRDHKHAMPAAPTTITGNAGTATALAANPTDCGEGQYAQSIDASGNLTCAQIGYAQINGTPSIPTVSDAVYDATTWDGNTDAPSKNAVKNKIESLALGASTATANTWQESQTHLKAITAPEYISSAGDGKIVARLYNTTAITAPPLIGSFGWLNDRYWLANGTNWLSRWLLDSSMIGVANGVQGYSARLDTVASMSGNSKYIGTNAAGEFGAHDVPTGGGSAYTLPPATGAALGGVIVGDNLTVDANGVLSADDQSYTPTAATAQALGVVRPGSGLSVDASGVLSVTLSEAASGFVTPPPTYSDSPCTAGQYAAGGGYQYICTATNTWDRIALTSWSNPTPQAQPPTLTARAIQTSGTSLQVTGSRALKAGAGGTVGWSMSCTTAGAVTVTYSSGLPGTTVNFGLDKTILNADTCTLSYTNPGTGILANDDDQALASFSEAAVTNNSTQYPAPTFTSRAIHADGDKIVLTGSESLKIGAGGSGGFTLACDDAGTVSMTYSSGAPGATLTYGLGGTILSDDDCTLDYSGTGILSNANDTPVASFSNAVVANNSTQSGGGDPYVPYQAFFYIAQAVADNARICLWGSTGTLVACTNEIDLSGIPDEPGSLEIISGTFPATTALASGTYYLGIMADHYFNYVPDPNAGSWSTYLINEYGYPATPGNITIPSGSNGSASTPAIWITNAAGNVLLGKSDVANHTDPGDDLGGDDSTLHFWQFTRVTLP